MWKQAKVEKLRFYGRVMILELMISLPTKSFLNVSARYLLTLASLHHVWACWFCKTYADQSIHQRRVCVELLRCILLHYHFWVKRCAAMSELLRRFCRNLLWSSFQRVCALNWNAFCTNRDTIWTWLTFIFLKPLLQLANYLRDQGVKKGDAVAIYMPMLLELPIAMLACARIGAVHSVRFFWWSCM